MQQNPLFSQYYCNSFYLRLVQPHAWDDAVCDFKYFVASSIVIIFPHARVVYVTDTCIIMGPAGDDAEE